MEQAGERLKKIRLEKGLSLEEVQKKTKVHLNILKAIEGEGLTTLNPVYLKGFVKIYCKFLGVDPKEYIPDYQEAPAPKAQEPKTSGSILEQPGNGQMFLKDMAGKLIAFRLPKKIIQALIFALIAAISVSFLFRLGKSISARPKKIAVQRKAKVPVVAAVPKPKETPSGIRLAIRAKENCWVDLKVDGKVVFRRILEKGRFESWQAKEKAELSVGNAAAIELEVNGQLFSNLGKRGQARKNIVITKDGVNIGR